MTSTASTASDRRRWPGKLIRRWPTLLAVTMAALSWGGGDADGAVGGFGEALIILPLVYLILSKVQRRPATWPVVITAVACMVALRAFEVIAPSVFFAVVALGVLAWGAVDGQLRRSGTFQVQSLGMLGFGGLSLIGLVVDPGLGLYLVAAGWFFHGVWDFVHLRQDKVVSRSFAEWCGVVDILVAVQLILMA